jgi:Ca2+-binding EF-hand superfamily protein
MLHNTAKLLRIVFNMLDYNEDGFWDFEDIMKILSSVTLKNEDNLQTDVTNFLRKLQQYSLEKSNPRINFPTFYNWFVNISRSVCFRLY